MEEVSLAGLTLHVADLDRSLEFYRHLPGAKVVVHRPGEFAMLRLGHGRLGLLQSRQPGGFRVDLETLNLSSIYDAFQNMGIEPDSPPREHEWGEMDFRITDPDGNTVDVSAAREVSRPMRR